MEECFSYKTDRENLIAESDDKISLGKGMESLPEQLGRELLALGGDAAGADGDLLACCREIMLLGVRLLQGRRGGLRKTVGEAAAACLEAKAGRRPRTRAEFRSVCARLRREAPELMEAPLGLVTTEMCREALLRVPTSDRQRLKMRTILHAVMAYAGRRGWCSGNPLAGLDLPPVREAEVEPLDWEALRRLLRLARRAEHRPCMPPLGLMLWAGIRPAEVCRLGWCHLDWEERVVVLRPLHAKTGGCRHVTIHPVLAAWLKEFGLRDEGAICPPNWPRRWKRLREEALGARWQQDVLRHTFASYHVKRWHDFARLQAEMGHRSADLLRSRYLSMRGVTAQRAAVFWRPGAL